MSEFSAIYYPYATIEDLELLKKAIFTFDKLFLIYPTIKRDSYRGLRLFHDKGKSKLIDEGTYDLVKSGFAEIIEPSETVKKFNDLMIACYDEDMEDHTFLDIGKGKSWTLYTEKVPTYDGGPSTILDPNYEGGVLGSDAVRPRIFISPTHRTDFRVTGDKIEMGLPNAASIMISHAVFNCIEKNLVPITNDPLAQRFLDRRLERGLHNLWHERSTIDRATLSALRTIQDKIIEMVIPDASKLMQHFTLKSILDFRADNQYLLSQYRRGMVEITDYVQNNIQNPNFEREIVKIAEDKINPVYDQLKRSSNLLPSFAVRPLRSFDPYSTAIGGTSMTIIGGKPISSAIVTTRETEISHEMSMDLLGKQSIKSQKLNYYLHV